MATTIHDISQEELGIIGRSPAIREAVDTLRRIAPTDLTVLLVGESGAGKEVFAHALRRLSSRTEKRMLSINCGAIPETLLESELFGHEKGAFTGAIESRKGIFEAADGGTILLDEIGEMSPATQVKLLRILESGEFTRVGSTDERKTDVRVIAATNRDLEQSVAEGTFRHDLYYRLNSATMFIPPLRERREDIQLLFAYFAYQASSRLKIPFGGITPEAIEVLVDYPWPGNIRELKNFTELIITLEKEEKITADTVFDHLDTSRVRPQNNPYGMVHLPGKTPDQAERELIYRALIDLRNEVVALKETVQANSAQGAAMPIPEQFALPPAAISPHDLVQRLDDLNLESVERAMIIGTLRKFNNSRRRAADALGISERTLYRKLNQYKDEGYIDDGEDDAENG
ncbi:MAG: sigma-54-dependent Fis family transcriptional regulator [Chlorobi bacterium]|nr:sigma-54-dependent Fis family transcriptional regulator [Chlorobiota bacterium]